MNYTGSWILSNGIISDYITKGNDGSPTTNYGATIVSTSKFDTWDKRCPSTAP
jgi:hypothetical protein